MKKWSDVIRTIEFGLAMLLVLYPVAVAILATAMADLVVLHPILYVMPGVPLLLGLRAVECWAEGP